MIEFRKLYKCKKRKPENTYIELGNDSSTFAEIQKRIKIIIKRFDANIFDNDVELFIYEIFLIDKNHDSIEFERIKKEICIDIGFFSHSYFRGNEEAFLKKIMKGEKLSFREKRLFNLYFSGKLQQYRLLLYSNLSFFNKFTLTVESNICFSNSL